MEYTLTLTQVEDMALSYVALSQQGWIDNAVHERCRIAIDEIISVALEKSIETGTSLPTSKDEIVLLAMERGWIETAADRQNKFVSQIND